MFCDTLLQYFPFISEHKELRSSYIAICVFNNLLTYTAVMLNIVTMHAHTKIFVVAKYDKDFAFESGCF